MNLAAAIPFENCGQSINGLMTCRVPTRRAYVAAGSHMNKHPAQAVGSGNKILLAIGRLGRVDYEITGRFSFLSKRVVQILGLSHFEDNLHSVVV